MTRPTTICLVAALAALAPAAARADARLTLTADVTTVDVLPASGANAPAPEAAAPRSPVVAAALSGGSLAAGLALLAPLRAADRDGTIGDARSTAIAAASATLVMVGPTLGHLYGDGRVLTTGMKMRLWALPAMTVAGLGWTTLHACEAERCADAVFGLTAASAIAAVGLLAGGAAHDVLTAAEATRAGNARRRARWSQLQVAPTMVATAGAPTPGLAVSGSF